MTAPLLTSGEAAYLLCTTRKQLLRWEQAGTITPAVVTVGGHRRFLASDVHALMGKSRRQRQDMLGEQD